MTRRLLAIGVVLALAAASCGPAPSPIASGVPAETAAPGAASAAPQETAEPTPTASDSASASGEPTPPTYVAGPTAADKIIAAQEAGILDEATALLYRVYAVFGDPRLPADYASDLWVEDGAALALAADRLDSLPGAVADELRPFLVRPTDPKSVFFTSAATALAPANGDGRVTAARAVAETGRTAAGIVCNTGWGYLDGAAPFRVWGACGTSTEQEITTVAGLMEDLWAFETAYMGREPLKDIGGSSQGDSDRIDIYLVGTCVTRGGICRSPGQFGITPRSARLEGPAAAQRTSAYMVINHGLVAAGNVKSTLAHEFFHVLQDAYNEAGTRQAGADHWFVEASATWAEWFFAPEAGAQLGGTYGRFASFQQSEYSLQTTASDNAYWSFVWPLFMEQAAGVSAVADAWKAIEGRVGHQQVTAAVNGILKFENRFRDFAVRAYNKTLSPGDPINPLFPSGAVGRSRIPPYGAKSRDAVTLHANPPDTPPTRTSEIIQSLYSLYRPFKVDSGVGQIKLDFSGLSPAGSFDADALLKIKDKGWERRKLEDGETKLCRNLDADEVEEMVIILSNNDMRPTTNVTGTWTVESLAEPCFGYKVQITWSDFWNGVEDHATFTGVIDKVDKEAIPIPGGVFLIGTGTVTGTRAAWAKCSVNLEPPDVGGKAEFGAQIIGDEVTVTAFSERLSHDGVVHPAQGGRHPVDCEHAQRGRRPLLARLEGTITLVRDERPLTRASRPPGPTMRRCPAGRSISMRRWTCGPSLGRTSGAAAIRPGGSPRSRLARVTRTPDGPATLLAEVAGHAPRGRGMGARRRPRPRRAAGAARAAG